jgi:hypothetical protein
VAEESILIFTDFEPENSDVRRGLGDAVKTAATVASEVAVETLAANMKGFLASLDRIMSASRDQVGGLELEEVQIHLQFDGRGNVGIAAIAGAQISAQGGMRLVLRRPRK